MNSVETINGITERGTNFKSEGAPYLGSKPVVVTASVNGVAVKLSVTTETEVFEGKIHGNLKVSISLNGHMYTYGNTRTEKEISETIQAVETLLRKIENYENDSRLDSFASFEKGRQTKIVFR